VNISRYRCAMQHRLCHQHCPISTMLKQTAKGRATKCYPPFPWARTCCLSWFSDLEQSRECQQHDELHKCAKLIEQPLFPTLANFASPSKFPNTSCSQSDAALLSSGKQGPLLLQTSTFSAKQGQLRGSRLSVALQSMSAPGHAANPLTNHEHEAASTIMHYQACSSISFKCPRTLEIIIPRNTTIYYYSFYSLLFYCYYYLLYI
jgi:hypothetical protein